MVEVGIALRPVSASVKLCLLTCLAYHPSLPPFSFD